ncbi:restriction endonuclease type II-like protein [Collybia nuda]|uniref:Restriction endonuclease type II-like protein n=1 Tax=Collybia nuda TaxID=64659 RepID=A0A9P5Y566_9AGAR|nr:restriction endonuclease type II-like protein [Collybia nuda]
MAVASTSTVTVPPVVPGVGNNIIINPLQRGNLLLDCIRNVGKEFGDIIADYQVGRTTGVLFLSLKYHRLHPEYIHIRVEKLGHSYSLRILLILCDITEHRDPIRELTKICLINNITVIVAFSLVSLFSSLPCLRNITFVRFDEAGHYLATLKQFEHKPPDMIKERVDKDYNSILRTALTSVSKVNKTDVETLRTSFGSFANVAKATPDQLRNLPGFGQVKVKNIKNAFDKPIRNNATRTILSVAPQTLDTHDDNNEVSSVVAVAVSTSTKLKEKEEVALLSERSRSREPSPIWEIELDLDGPGSAIAGVSPRMTPFDIELDLN